MSGNKTIEVDEEKEPTIKLDNLEDIPEPQLDEEEVSNTTDKKYTTEEKFIITETEEEKTNEEKVVEEVVREPNNKNKNKKLIIAIAAVVLVVLVLIIALFLKKDTKADKTSKTKKEENSYVTKLNKYLKDGSIDEEIKKALTSVNLNTEEVKILSMDIDSDDDQELVAYAEDDEKKYILYFEVEEDIYHEDSIQVDSAQSIGYAYSLNDKDAYYYTEFEGTYTIIGYTKTVEKEESFLEKYFPITKEYASTPILDRGQSYKLDKKLDVKKLDKEKITAESILEDNDTTLFKINEAANKYVSEREEEKRKKEEEEQARKEAEEKAAREEKSTIQFNSFKLHYGKYMPDKKGKITKLTINEDGTGTINSKLCTWKEDKSSSESNSTPIIKFTCDDEEYELHCNEDDILTTDDEVKLKYEA